MGDSINMHINIHMHMQIKKAVYYLALEEINPLATLV